MGQFQTRNIDWQSNKSGSNTTVVTFGPYAVGDCQELMLHFEASLASSDASQPTGTLSMFHPTGNASYLKVSDTMPYGYKVWSKTYTGAAGGGATVEGSTEAIGAGLANNVSFGAWVWFEFQMNAANQTFTGADFDIWGK